MQGKRLSHKIFILFFKVGVKEIKVRTLILGRSTVETQPPYTVHIWGQEQVPR